MPGANSSLPTARRLWFQISPRSTKPQVIWDKSHLPRDLTGQRPARKSYFGGRNTEHWQEHWTTIAADAARTGPIETLGSGAAMPAVYVVKKMIPQNIQNTPCDCLKMSRKNGYEMWMWGTKPAREGRGKAHPKQRRQHAEGSTLQDMGPWLRLE